MEIEPRLLSSTSTAAVISYFLGFICYLRACAHRVPPSSAVSISSNLCIRRVSNPLLAPTSCSPHTYQDMDPPSAANTADAAPFF